MARLDAYYRDQPYAVAASLLIGGLGIWVPVIIAHLYLNIPFQTLVVDPNSLANQPFYFGAVSYVGILIWSSAAAISIWTSLHTRDRKGGLQCPMLLYGGLLSALLVLDDLFMLHESAAPAAGIPESALYGLYGLLLLGFLVRFVPAIAHSPWLLLLGAVGFFGGSVTLDVLPLEAIVRHPALLEDMMKFFGVLFWAAYFLAVSHRVLVARHPSAG